MSHFAHASAGEAGTIWRGAIEHNSSAHGIAKGLFALDIRRLDDGPPLFDFGLLEGSKRLGRLLVAWENLLPEVGEACAHRRVGQSGHDGVIEPGNNIPWRGRRHPKGLPVGEVE